MPINGTPGADTLTGLSGDDVINGLGGNDKIDGGAGNDVIDGGDGADIIKGGDGDDVLTGGLGNDSLVGGSGKDTAIYATTVAAASTGAAPIGTWNLAVLTLTTSQDGTDVVNQVETLRFNGQDFAVTGYAKGETYNVVANLGADAGSGNQDTGASGNVLANDYDVDSRLAVTGLRLAGSGAPASMPIDDPKAIDNNPADFAIKGQYGVLSLYKDGSYRYTAFGEGTDHFQYSVTDGGVTRWVNLDLTAIHLNHAPVTDGATASGEANAPINGQLTARDVDGDRLDFRLDSGPSHGSVGVNPDGSFTYKPAADYIGADSFTYTVQDGHGGTTTGTAHLTVKPPNHAPVIDEAASVELPLPFGIDTPAFDVALPNLTRWSVNGLVEANGSPYGGVIRSDGGATIEEVAAALGVTVDYINGFGQFLGATIVSLQVGVQPSVDEAVFKAAFKPASENSADRFFVYDGYLQDLVSANPGQAAFQTNLYAGIGRTTTIVLINYAGDDGASSLTLSNAALWGSYGPRPLIVSGGAGPQEDTPFAGQLHASDSDGDDLTFSLVSGQGPAHGSVVINGDGSFVYTPDANFFGDDAFTYQVSDGRGGTDTATLTLKVAGVVDRPTVTGASVSGDEDTVISGSVTGSDPDGDKLNFGASQGQHGEVHINSDGTFTYTPEANFNGEDSFTVSSYDGRYGSVEQVVHVTVNPVNDAPVIDENHPVAYGPAFSASVPGLTITAIGHFGDVAPGSLSIVPELYYANGGTLYGDGQATLEQLQALSGVSQQVIDALAARGHIDGITLLDLDYIVPEQTAYFEMFGDVLAFGANDLLFQVSSRVTYFYPQYSNRFEIFQNVDNHAPGQHAHLLLALIDYAGDGVTPEINIHDLSTFDHIYPGSRTLHINQVPVTPILEGPVKNTPFQGRFSATDIEGDSLTFSLAQGGAPAHGQVVVNADGSFTYTPEKGFAGADSFTYQVSDGHGGVDTATWSFQVANVNQPPVAEGGSSSQDPVSGVITGAAQAEDPDGDPLVFTVDAGPNHGSLDLHPDGTFTYTPDKGYLGGDSFTYLVSDGNGGSAGGGVDLTVGPHNAPPIAKDANFEIDEDQTIEGKFPVSDADGDVLTYRISDPQHGSLRQDRSGGFIYRPDADWSGVDGVDFEVDDGHGGHASGHLTFTVNAVNDVPFVQQPLRLNVDEDGAVKGRASAQDVEHDKITFELVGDAPKGLVFNPDGTWFFDAAKDATYQSLDFDQAVTISFSYRAYDGQGYSTPVTQEIRIFGHDEEIAATAGKDTISGSAIGDYIDGLAGDDILKGLGGNDQLRGGEGSDKLYGGDGGDQMYGGAGIDTVNGEAGNDVLNGDAGADTLDGGDGDDWVFGGDDNDTVKGGAGNDRVFGDAGNDDVQGGAGDDWVTGGAGADRLSGGLGADRFVFADGDLGSTLGTSDAITDFKTLQGDFLDLSGIDADTTLAGDQAFSLVSSFGAHAGEMTMVFNAGINATVISMDTNGDGVADYVLQLTGNVSSTAGWVL